mmetsp:Transcript_19272/g.35995  ORF Transcript_19272/g.35995 Transcript_19272/m.35995 type:complete len:411 (-) Transcript_19272:203-1435(-)
MKFTTAASLLVGAASHVQPSLSHTIGSNADGTMFDVEAQNLLQHMGHNPPQRYRKLQTLLAKKQKKRHQQDRHSKILTNTQPDNQAVECHKAMPSSSNTDVGILSACPVGQYCMESKNSSLGGVCVSEREERATKLALEASRNLEDEDETFVEKMEELCRLNLGDTLTCSTCAVDSASYTASVDCTYDQVCYELGSLCSSDKVEFCGDETVTASLRGEDDFEIKTCYELKEPDEFNYCISYSYSPDSDPTCEIEIDGILCNSCTLVQDGEEGEWCREFDCENTIVQRSATICEYSLLFAFAALYLYKELPCPGGCNLCGDGLTMDKPATKTFSVANVATRNCLQAQINALTGEYSTQQCNELSVLVDEPCGCSTPAPTSAPAPRSGSSNEFPTSTWTTAGAATLTAMALI